MDRSQNFARSVGREEMQKICECLRVTVSNLSNFFMGKIDAPRLKVLLFRPLIQDKPITNVSQKNAKRKRVNPNKTSSKKKAKKKTLDQDKPVIFSVEKDANKNKLDNNSTDMNSKPVTPTIQKDVKKLNLSKPVAPPIQKDAKKKITLRPDSGNNHVHKKKVKHIAHNVHAANTPASGSRPPTIFTPPQMHRAVPSQPIGQFLHVPQQLVAPSLLAHGLPGPQLHPAYHPHQGLVSQGNFVNFNHGIQLPLQGLVMFPPAAAHRPVMDVFHPYAISGPQQMHHYDNRLVQRPPYGIGPSFWR